MTDDLRERVARAIAPLIQPLSYDELPDHRKAVSPRADWDKADMLEIADAAIDVPDTGDVLPNGWVAPDEATEEMATASGKFGFGNNWAKDFWKAMRAAAIRDTEEKE